MSHFFWIPGKLLKESTMLKIELLFLVELLSLAFSMQKCWSHNRFLSKTQGQQCSAKNLKIS